MFKTFSKHSYLLQFYEPHLPIFIQMDFYQTPSIPPATNMRWVFIRPLNHSCYYDPEVQEPLGIEYLSACMRERGDTVLILDGPMDNASDVKLARRAVSFQPDAIGFSITTAFEIESVLAIVEECQRVLEGFPVRWLAGGNYISTEPLHARNSLPDFFFLVRFEGERALQQLADNWTTKDNNLDLANNALCQHRIYSGQCLENLDEIPFPVRPFADQILQRGWSFNVQGSRGCCGNCKYCSSPGMAGGKFSRWRGRTMFNIVDEIEWLYRELGAKSFSFIDEDFLGPKIGAMQRARAFAEEIARRSLPVSFGIQVRPHTLGDEIIEILGSTGVVFVFMGLESDDSNDFKRWGRPWVSDPWRFISQFQDRGIEVNVGVMLFHAHSTFRSIGRFAKKLHNYHLFNYRSAINRMDAMPGSFFYKTGIKNGMLDPDTTGPQPIPFIYSEIEAFHKDLLNILAPLGPPSMHALCALPMMIARRASDENHDASCRKLKQIIYKMDQAVYHTFSALLVHHERGYVPKGLCKDLRRYNFNTALAGVRDLTKYGFAHSFEELREAIRIDSEM